MGEISVHRLPGKRQKSNLSKLDMSNSVVSFTTAN